MHGLDLNLFVALDALLQDASVVGRPRASGLTPPVMSRALGRLHAALSDPLFVRAGRRLVPTPRATALRERVHATFAEAQAVLRPDAPVELERMQRRFTVRADDAVVTGLGPALLARMAAAAPAVTVVFAAEGDEDVCRPRLGSVHGPSRRQPRWGRAGIAGSNPEHRARSANRPR